MAVTATRVTVTTTAVALNTASTGGLTLRIKNGAAILAVGPAGVTTASGYEVAASAEVTVELDPGDVLFGVTGSTSNVQILAT